MAKSPFTSVLLREDHTGLAAPGFSSLLDAMRWIAALCVVTTHASWRVLVPRHMAQDDSLITTAFYAATSFGHQAVMVFFVLSGYLVGGRSVTAIAQRRFDIRDYLSARTARLYAVLLPAIVLTALCDWSSNQLTGGTGFHARPGYQNLDWETALINLLMLQHLYGPTFGSNAPLWSLAYEFWFYMVFAALAQCVLKQGVERWIYGAVAAATVYLLGATFACYAVMWIIGLVAAVIPRRTSGTVSVLAATMFFLAALPSAHFIDQVLPRFASDLFQSIAAGVLLWTLKARPLGIFAKLRPINTYLADFSYSLYAVHYPLLLLTLTVIGGPVSTAGYSMELALGPTGLITFFLAIVVCIAGSWLFALGTEQKTPMLRRWLRAKLRAFLSPTALTAFGGTPSIASTSRWFVHVSTRFSRPDPRRHASRGSADPRPTEL